MAGVRFQRAGPEQQQNGRMWGSQDEERVRETLPLVA